MEGFIIALIETGSVRRVADRVDRYFSTVYNTRARVPEFARAWDAARRTVYARLRDEAMEHALEGGFEQVWNNGELVGMKREFNDRLLMNLLNHLRHKDLANTMRPRAIDEVEDERSANIATQLGVMAMLPPQPPPAPVRLHAAKLRLGIEAINGVALVSPWSDNVDFTELLFSPKACACTPPAISNNGAGFRSGKQWTSSASSGRSKSCCTK